MSKENGFTMIELLVVVGIVGILAVTAVPLYRTWQQRAYGSEAAIMVKQILEAQIVYFLDHDKFFPEDDQTILITHDTPPNDEKIQQVSDALKLTITTGHFLDYSFGPLNAPGNE